MARRGNNEGRPFTALVAALLGLLLLYPFFLEGDFGPIVFEVLFSLVFVTGVLAVSPRHRLRSVALTLAAPTFATRWAAHFYAGDPLLLSSLVLTLLFVVFVTLTVLRAVLGAARVSMDTIQGGVSAYLLIGIAWSVAFAILELLAPSSFMLGDVPVRAEFSPPDPDQLLPHPVLVFPQLLYYSFVTLTTLGYGDIVPATHPARVLSVLEAITGQLFVAILIAGLVGIHVSHSRRE